MSPSDLSVSVVIISKNEERTLTRCVESALSQTHPVEEVIIIDGNSTDSSIAIARGIAKRNHRVRLTIESIDSPHSGPAAARNLGAAQSSGDLILFMNADVFVDVRYVSRLIEEMEERSLVAAAGLRWNVGESRVAGLMNVHYALNYNSSQRTLDDPAFLSGDAVLIRAASFRSVGGYDPEMPSGEDADIGYRLKGVGHRLGYVSELTIWHEGQHYGTFSAWVKQMEWYGRGAAALVRLHPWRRERERTGVDSHVRKPVAIFLAALLFVLIAASTSGLIFLGIVGLGFAGLSFKYARSLMLAKRACQTASLPTQPQPIDFALYPIFRTLRYGLLSFFTWLELMRHPESQPSPGAGDPAV